MGEEEFEENKMDQSMPLHDNSILSLSNQATTDLLGLLLQRGYFHHDGGDTTTDEEAVIRSDPQRGNPRDETKSLLPKYSVNDDNCQMVFLVHDSDNNDNESSCCCTYPALESKLRNLLETRGGRASLKELVTALRLRDERPLLRILERQQQSSSNKYHNHVFQQGEDLISSLYLDRKSQQLFDSLLLQDDTKESHSNSKPNGVALVSHVATHEFHLPMDVTLRALEDRVSKVDGIQILQLDAGAALVSDQYLERGQRDVLDVFAALREPTTITDICLQQSNRHHRHYWDAGLVTTWVQEACANGKLEGEIHGGTKTTSSGGGMYKPHAHVQALRQSVDELFAAQGYMTAARGAALGLSKSKMGEYILESFPSAVIVSDSLVVNPETIVTPLQAVLQEAITMDSFVDLQDHLPTDILEQEQDARLLLNNHVMPALLEPPDSALSSNKSDSKTNKQKKKAPSAVSVGVIVLSSISNGGLFVSDGMIQTIREKIFPDLIARFAKERAETIDASEVAGDNNTSSSKQQSKSNSSKKKGGRKGKKGAKASSDPDDDKLEDSSAENILPLEQVVRAITSEYVELVEVDLVAKEALGSASLPHMTWDKSTGKGQDSGDGADSCNAGLICEFCRVAFFSEDLVSKCQQAVDAELKRLQSARMSKASVSRKEAATKVRNVESAFEESFITACYQLQSQVKFIEYVAGGETITEEDKGNKALVQKLTEQLLQGCCADFTRRLTQYCLFKNEVDLDMFRFSDKDVAEGDDRTADKSDGMLPVYCILPDLTNMHYPKTYFDSNVEAAGDSSSTTEPLAKLREVLPGSLGVNLARQWVMVGGNCYKGGTKLDEGGNNFTRPGDLEKFMSHVEENCLPLCGLPFRKLDKKSEKQFLFARRQRLLQLLEQATTSNDGGGGGLLILDLAMMLLFQQVKNVTAFALPSCRTEVLQLLSLERKVSEPVAQALSNLLAASTADDGGEVDTELMEKVRACGLSRDISKHQIV